MQRSAYAPAILAALSVVLSSCSPSETSASEPGTLTTRDEIQPAGTAKADAGSPGADNRAQAEVVAKEQAPAPCETPGPSVSGGDTTTKVQMPASGEEILVSAAVPLDETALAKELALRPEAFDEWLAANSGQVEGARRDLMLGLAAGLRGETKRAKALLTQIEGKSKVRTSELTALRRLADPSGKAVVPAAAAKDSPVAMAAILGAVVRRAKEASRTGKTAEAAQRWSEAVDLQQQAPWRLDLAEIDVWSKQVADVQAQRRWNPLGDWPSHDLSVGAGDSLIAVRKRALQLDPQLLVCTGQIARANGLRNERIHPGQKLRVPKDHAKVVVDIEGHMVLYYLGEELAALWPCGVGAQNSPTKAGVYTVGEKTRNPMWFRPGAEPVPHGDPANPLGTRWIEWMDDRGRSSGFGFHGTNEPRSIGGNGSQGCIRMRDDDVEELYEILPKGARIEVRR